MRIGFVTSNAYNILTKGGDSIVGGAEVQQVYIGKELARRGHEVYFIENASNEKEPGVVDGIEIYLRKRRSTTNRISQVANWVSSTYRALRDINPDVCYLRVLSFDVVPVAVSCHITDTEFVYAFAHDSEVTEQPATFDSSLTQTEAYKFLIRAALSSSDALVSQNEFQHNHAKKRFNSPVKKIPNGYPLGSVVKESNVFEDIQKPIALWVGTIRKTKDPTSLIKIAENLPEVYFVIIGGEREEEFELYRRIQSKAEKMDNVHFAGFVPHSEVLEYFSAADIFVNTSRSEGFPNTFLEAWAHGVPTFSLRINPDSIITKHNIGFVAEGSLEELRSSITSTVNNPQQLKRLSENAKQYLQQNHSIERITDYYERVFECCVE